EQNDPARLWTNPAFVEHWGDVLKGQSEAELTRQTLIANLRTEVAMSKEIESKVALNKSMAECHNVLAREDGARRAMMVEKAIREEAEAERDRQAVAADEAEAHAALVAEGVDDDEEVLEELARLEAEDESDYDTWSAEEEKVSLWGRIKSLVRRDKEEEGDGDSIFNDVPEDFEEGEEEEEAQEETQEQAEVEQTEESEEESEEESAAAEGSEAQSEGEEQEEGEELAVEPEEGEESEESEESDSEGSMTIEDYEEEEEEEEETRPLMARVGYYLALPFRFVYHSVLFGGEFLYDETQYRFNQMLDRFQTRGQRQEDEAEYELSGAEEEEEEAVESDLDEEVDESTLQAIARIVANAEKAGNTEDEDEDEEGEDIESSSSPDGEPSEEEEEDGVVTVSLLSRIGASIRGLFTRQADEEEEGEDEPVTVGDHPAYAMLLSLKDTLNRLAQPIAALAISVLVIMLLFHFVPVPFFGPKGEYQHRGDRGEMVPVPVVTTEVEVIPTPKEQTEVKVIPVPVVEEEPLSGREFMERMTEVLLAEFRQLNEKVDALSTAVSTSAPKTETVVVAPVRTEAEQAAVEAELSSIRASIEALSRTLEERERQPVVVESRSAEGEQVKVVERETHTIVEKAVEATVSDAQIQALLDSFKSELRTVVASESAANKAEILAALEAVAHTVSETSLTAVTSEQAEANAAAIAAQGTANAEAIQTAHSQTSTAVQASLAALTDTLQDVVDRNAQRDQERAANAERLASVETTVEGTVEAVVRDVTEALSLAVALLREDMAEGREEVVEAVSTPLAASLKALEALSASVEAVATQDGVSEGISALQESVSSLLQAQSSDLAQGRADVMAVLEGMEAGIAAERVRVASAEGAEADAASARKAEVLSALETSVAELKETVLSNPCHSQTEGGVSQAEVEAMRASLHESLTAELEGVAASLLSLEDVQTAVDAAVGPVQQRLAALAEAEVLSAQEVEAVAKEVVAEYAATIETEAEEAGEGALPRMPDFCTLSMGASVTKGPKPHSKTTKPDDMLQGMLPGQCFAGKKKLWDATIRLAGDGCVPAYVGVSHVEGYESLTEDRHTAPRRVQFTGLTRSGVSVDLGTYEYVAEGEGSDVTQAWVVETDK
ncbi:hypothetical protein KIPB_009710, partial [Kipferlia bialata]